MRDMTGSQESWEKCLRWSCWKPRRQRSHYLRLYWSTNRPPTQHAQRSRSPTMRMYPRDFPPSRRKIPKRRAERQVYEALAGSDRRGFCYYEWRKGYGHIELDFAVWVEELGRFALQVKGGHYLLSDGEWRLKTRYGVQPIPASPLDGAWLAMLDLHDDIEELAETAYNPFVISVLLFPDMEPDPAIMKLACRKVYNGLLRFSGTNCLRAAVNYHLYQVLQAAGLTHGKGMQSYLCMMAVRLLNAPRAEG